jgi:hypothetical protein
MDPIKQRALEMANHPGSSPEQVIDRAEKYERYLRAEVKSSEPVLPLGDDGQPDALHG